MKLETLIAILLVLCLVAALAVTLAAPAHGADPPPVALMVEVTEMHYAKERLVWKGTAIFSNGKRRSFKHEIDLRNSRMYAGKEGRYFNPSESLLFSLPALSTLMNYAAESSAWWFAGKGSKEPVKPTTLKPREEGRPL